ncbi:unnamed protein product [Protopolystoma xenopodis]|uniref:Uncharacterized protein n=1 Tax=Protopolystoma xenopodis TaxID=117903 RepID=A0A3S5B1M2_9PLAT|nr:unnamed protein product [Protopolystoma xenopodis]
MSITMTMTVTVIVVSAPSDWPDLPTWQGCLWACKSSSCDKWKGGVALSRRNNLTRAGLPFAAWTKQRGGSQPTQDRPDGDRARQGTTGDRDDDD